MVSTFNSPAKPHRGGLCGKGLPGPGPLRLGEVSTPLDDGDTLVGGDVPNPWEETGERTGDGDRFWAANAVEFADGPAMYSESRFDV